MKDGYGELFIEEARELLTDLESSLLELENDPGDVEVVGKIFRALHTIKGSGAMFGFEEVAAFTHEVETVFDLVRNGRLTAGTRMVNLTLAAADIIAQMLGFKSRETGSEGDAARIVGELKVIAGHGGAPPPERKPPPSPSPPKKTPAPSDEVVYRIRFRPTLDIFRQGTDPILLLRELRELGTCEIVGHLDAVPDLFVIDPEGCYAYWDVLIHTTATTDAIRDVFIFIEDDCELTVERLDDEIVLDQEESGYKRFGDILVERGDADPAKVEAVMGNRQRIGRMLVDAGVVEPSKIEAVLAEQRAVREVRERRKVEEQSTSIRVSAEKLDVLVDLVGEMVTVQARLTQRAGTLNDASLFAVAEEVERLTAELRDNTMSIRMLPIGKTFDKFKRLVRDLSLELGKEIDMVVEGAETELDKTVIDRLGDPLVHLVRNSIDHGIELPKARESLGKPRRGTVHLSALHSGANVLITISDDGAGIDTEAVRARAVERGIVAPHADLSEKEVYSLIFAPGFSTAKEVTSVSGRGVGMDVVKRNIDALGGSIDIASRMGEGSSVTLKLPLTLAIIDGLLVEIGEDFFVMPLSAVEECIEIRRTRSDGSQNRDITFIRGEIIPYISLRDRFRIEGNAPEVEQIVVCEAGGGRVGFVVDNVVGGHQTVIKSLGRVYRDVEGISGATILGDGTVALILDIPRLVRDVERMEEEENGER